MSEQKLKSMSMTDAPSVNLSHRPQIELVPLPKDEIAAKAFVTEVDGVATPVTKPWWQKHGLFIGVFLLPVAIAAIYFAFIASDIYVSETKFILRSPGKAESSGIPSLGQGEVNTRSDDDAYALIEFIKSRDAARSMELDHGMRDIMSRNEADIFSRFPSMFAEDNQENFFKAYREHVRIDLDGVTGIVTLVARAYRPNDALGMANSLLNISETFVNGLSTRANRDAENFAKSFLAQSQLELANVESELAVYRTSQSVLDPRSESEAFMSQIGRMSAEIARMEAALAQQRSMAPNSPSLKPLEGQIKAYREQLATLRGSIVGNQDSAVSKIKDYELLMLRRDIAAKKIGFAAAQFEKARQDAQNHRIYLQRVVEPSLPDVPAYPYRILMTLAVAALAFACYRIVKSMVASTMEHRA